ncbi:MAG: S41 family peptidase [Firmicutes bacterium]|nr:S41 family peptidase [Bacillota bacterium]
MTINRTKFILCIIGAFLAGALVMGSAVIIKGSGSDSGSSKFEEIKGYISEYYLEDYDEEKLMEEAYRGYVEGLGDPYTAYMTEKEYESWEVSSSDEYGGVGITFSMDEDGAYVVQQIYKDSPAEKAGIEPGDVLLKVDGKVYKDINVMSSKIRGEEGSKVELTYSRDGKEKTAVMERASIKQESVESEMLDEKTGYIQISSFIESTGGDFSKALKKIEKNNAEYLVLDLRDNGGGLVDESVKVADAFLDKGVVCHVEDKNGNTDTYDAEDGKTKLKTVVLINENSASASEILAGALKDNGFEIIGTKSFGKGVIQGTFNLKDGSAVKITMMQYLSPDKHEIHKKGIKPTVKIKDNEKTEADEQLDKAIEVIKK